MSGESITAVSPAYTKKVEQQVKTDEKTPATGYSRQCGVPCSQYYQNSYFNQSMSGIDDIFLGMNPIYGGSIFSGGGMGMPGMGYPGVGMNPYNMTPEEYINYQKQYMKGQDQLEDMQIDRQVNRKKRLEAANFSSNAAENKVSQAVAVLNGAVIRNEQDHIIPLYSNLVASVREKLKETNGFVEIDDSQVRAEAQRVYAENTGRSLAEDVSQNGHGAFTHGFLKGATFGLLSDNKNSDENVAYITGEPRSKSSYAASTTGTVIGGTLAVLGGVLALWHGGKHIKDVPKVLKKLF